MKRVLLILSTILWVQACNVQTEKPEVIDEEYEPSDEELFKACSDLKGINQFIIGKTTFRQVLSDKDYRAGTTSYDRESNFFNGHWGNDFWKSKYDEVATWFKKAEWINKQSKGKIKQLYIPVTGLKVGGLKFERFDMAFLNDTLVAIWFYPENAIEEEVISHYKEKYGDGRGYYKYYNSSSHVKNDIKSLTVTTTTDEKRTWANETVALDYVNNEYFHVEPGQGPTGNYTHSMLIYSKNRFPIFETTLKDLAEKYDSIQQESKKSSLDNL